VHSPELKPGYHKQNKTKQKTHNGKQKSDRTHGLALTEKKARTETVMKVRTETVMKVSGLGKCDLGRME
jgi:hypothetical protein